MCDYSLQHVQSRAAKVGDKLITKDFGTGTRGFAERDGDPNVAVCLLPGTEIAFEYEPKVISSMDPKVLPMTARFRQINKEHPHMHHDCLEFADGRQVLLTYMASSQAAVVLQLPAAPTNEAEAQEQKRLEIVA